MLLAVAGGDHARTQWEVTFGGYGIERGHDAVHVTKAFDGGWIAVGSTESVGALDTGYTIGDTGIYVCRTTESGARMWEYRYDINGEYSDVAHGIIELRNEPAYVIVGSTGYNDIGGAHAFMMKIDTNGTEIWTRTYDLGPSAVGYDIIEATQGNGTETLAGDLVICGRVVLQPRYGGGNGFVMRTDSAGAPRWKTSPIIGAVPQGSGQLATSDEWFNALIEIQTHGGIGDIVAAGVATNALPGSGLGCQGYVARLEGLHGFLTGINHGVTYYGDTASEGFQDVVELQRAQGAWSGNLLFVGWTGTLGATFDPPSTLNIYLVKTDQDRCGKVNAKVFGNFSNDSLREFAMGVEEVRYSGYYGGDLDTGDVVITGAAQTSTSLSLQMMLLPVETGNLTVVASAQHYGDEIGSAAYGYCNGMFWEIGESVRQVSDGFGLCGVSGGNLEYDTTMPDYNDLYLVRTDDSGMSTCSRALPLDDSSVVWADSCEIPEADSSWTYDDPAPDVAVCVSMNLVCYAGSRPDPCSLCKRRYDVDPATGVERARRLQLSPNPAREGDVVHLDGRSLIGTEIHVAILDNAGRVVRCQSLHLVDGSATVAVPTDGLPTGSYVMIIDDGPRRLAGRLVIVN